MQIANANRVVRQESAQPRPHGSVRKPRLRAVRTCAVLAPPVSKQSKDEDSQPAPSAGAPQGILSAFSGASQFVNGLKLWPTTPQSALLASGALERVKPEPDQGQAPPDITACLQECSSEELRYMRKLVHLSSQTYYMDKLVPSKVQKWHGMELISTSLCCERVTYSPALNAEETMCEGDGMATSMEEAMDVYKSLKRSVDSAPRSMSNVVPFRRLSAPTLKPAAVDSTSLDASELEELEKLLFTQLNTAEPSVQKQQPQTGEVSLAVGESKEPSSEQQQQQRWNPADIVAAKLSEAAAAASSAALQPLASAAGSLYAGSLSLVSSAFNPAPQSDRVASMAIAGIASAEVAASHPNSKEVKEASTSGCPSEWFVVDDHESMTRYFVIQGSDSIDHWKTNITFEPMEFEGTGIKVHRGAYEAALVLYDRFLPLVQEQSDKDPFARICFTGHSIGGSLATLLMLMFVSRGVLAPMQVAPVYTFGAPAIFCEACSCDSCDGQGQDHCSLSSGETGLLASQGLPPDAIRNVFMTRDIVPRAFSCDYSLVAELLRSWGPHWREHRCLNGSARKQMYAFVGQMVVLQPSRELTCFSQEPYHPLLEPKSEAWVLEEASLASIMAGLKKRAAAVREGRPMGTPVGSADEALAALMDNPHPLETLADPGAYMDHGSISRYHNPDNYTRAIGRLLAERRGQHAASLAAPSNVPATASKQRPFFPAGEAAAAGDEGLQGEAQLALSFGLICPGGFWKVM